MPEQPGESLPPVQLQSRPSQRSIEAIAEAAREVIEKTTDAGLGSYLEWHRDRLALDYEWMEQVCRKDDKVCELGAWPFFLTRALLRAGFDVTAVRLPLDADLADAVGISLIQCNIETQPLPFPARLFDHVLLNEVFEHLRIDLIATMREVRRVLHPGGKLWLSTPNLRSLRGIVNFIWNGEAWSTSGEGLYNQYQEAGRGVMGHVREYTAKEITEFLRAVGYSIEQVIYRGTYANAGARVLSTVAPSLKPYYSILAHPV